MPITVSNILGNQINNSGALPDGLVEAAVPVTIAAAGTTQATATLIANEINTISNNTAANGVVLPVALAGQKFYIYPALATNAPKLYPPVGGTINGAAANASLAITAQKLTTVIALDAAGNFAVALGA